MHSPTPEEVTGAKTPKDIHDRAKSMHPTTSTKVRVVLAVLALAVLLGIMVLREQFREVPETPALLGGNVGSE